MRKIILTTPEELASLMDATVRKAIASYSSYGQTVQPDRLLTIEEAAEYLSLAKQTLYGFTSKNLIPHIKRAKRLLFKRSDLDMWLMEGRKKSVSEIKDELKNR